MPGFFVGFWYGEYGEKRILIWWNMVGLNEASFCLFPLEKLPNFAVSKDIPKIAWF